MLYCYGGKEYFDSSIKVLFDIFPLLMGDEHEIYIYIYMYIIFEEMFEVKNPCPSHHPFTLQRSL